MLVVCMYSAEYWLCIVYSRNLKKDYFPVCFEGQTSQRTRKLFFYIFRTRNPGFDKKPVFTNSMYISNTSDWCVYSTATGAGDGMQVSDPDGGRSSARALATDKLQPSNPPDIQPDPVDQIPQPPPAGRYVSFSVIFFLLKTFLLLFEIIVSH